MDLPQRKPPGPIKRFDRYFTIPINQAILNSFEQLKWRTRLDKTEVARRLLDYFLTLPPDSQDKILHSFDDQEKERLRKLRRNKKKVKAVATYFNTAAPGIKPEPERDPAAPIVVPRAFKRSGLP